MDNQKETPAELGEIISTASFVLGLASGWNDAATHLRKLAGHCFVNNQDDRAFMLRDLAEELETIAKKERATYDKEQRPEKERAFTELEKLSSKEG